MPASPPMPPSRHNLGLDLVRAGAILAVLFSHSADWWMGAGRQTDIAAAYIGRAGVEAFFSLSGFLIGGILLRDIEGGFGWPELRRFWARRWMRTLPAYWAVLLGLNGWFGTRGDWYSFVFAQNWVPRTLWTPLTIHTWSLALEEWFYLFVPLLLIGSAALLGRRRRGWAVPLACLALVVACTAGRAAAGTDPHPFWGPEPPTNPLLRLDCACWGLLAAWLARGRPLPALAAWALLGVGGAALLLMGYIWGGVFAPERLAPWGPWAQALAWAPVRPVLEEAGAACTVLALRRLAPRGWGPLAWAAGAVAALSYALYLVHVPVIYLLRASGFDDAAGWGARGVMAGAVLVAAMALRWGVERPALMLRERLAPDRPRCSPATAAALHGRPPPRRVSWQARFMGPDSGARDHAADARGTDAQAPCVHGRAWQGSRRSAPQAKAQGHPGTAAMMPGPPQAAVSRLSGWVAARQASAAVFACFAAILLARNPSVLLHAEFWAEDGWAWYPDAYNNGLRALAVPVAGYLQTLPRLVASLAQPFPMAWAPTGFALAALLVQALPPWFLVSSRMAGAWPNASARLLFALLWLALPNTREVYVNLTNAQWHLATLAFLVLLSQPPVHRTWRAFDAAVLLVSAFSGPFCIVLMPVAAWLAWQGRDRASLERAVIMLAGTAIQGLCILATIGDRAPAVLGAGPRLLARIVSQQVVLGAVIGQGNMPLLTATQAWQTNVLPVLAATLAIILAAAALLGGSRALRLTVLSASLLFGAALLRPQINSDGSQWVPMQIPGAGQRYYYIPMLAWVAALLSLAGSAIPWRRVAGTLLLGCMCVGLWSDWRITPQARSRFVAQAHAFEAAPPGTQMAFEFPPLFDALPMRLTKR